MKAITKLSGCLMMAAMGVLLIFIPVNAGAAEISENDTILDGVYVDNISLAGKTEAEAAQLIDAYIGELLQKNITLQVIDDQTVTVTPAEMGFTWGNPEVVGEAAVFGKKGNVIQRYKAQKDLENADKVFPLEFYLDTAMITDIINEQCTVYNQAAIDATMSFSNGEAVVTEGQAGRRIDVRNSVELVYNYLQEEWNREDCTISLAVEVAEPRGSAEELRRLTDVLGTFSTSYSTSSRSRSANIANGCNLISGTLLYPGDEFSAYEAVAPFTANNGYFPAGSYENGRVVDSLGGGICQVSTTLYNSVLLAELEVTERHNHSMIVSYVDPSADAAIAESAGKDFRFINNKQFPIYIEGTATENKILTFTIYGVEERPASRTIEYISETLEIKPSAGEAVYQDAGQPIGVVLVESEHIGRRARLWKVVKENGVEISKEEVNSSNYMASPRRATVGTATGDPNALNHIMAAIATNNIDHIKNVAAALQAQTAVPPAPVDPNQPPAPADPNQPPAAADPNQQQPAADPNQQPAPADPNQPPAPTDPNQPPAPTDPAQPSAEQVPPV